MVNHYGLHVVDEQRRLVIQVSVVSCLINVVAKGGGVHDVIHVFSHFGGGAGAGGFVLVVVARLHLVEHAATTGHQI